MGINIRRGQTSAPDTAAGYDRPALSGVTNTRSNEVYRRGVVADVDYEPNGNVYERGGDALGNVPDTLSTGGQYQRSLEYEAPPVPLVYIESQLYPVFWQESLYLDNPIIVGYSYPHTDSMAASGEITSGTLQQLLKSYTNWPSETMNLVNSEVTSGTLVVALISYTNWPSETMQLLNSEITGGTLV